MIIAGPCSVESPEQIASVAEGLKSLGVSCLRGGVWKPRTHPGAFEGIGEPALPWLVEAGHSRGLSVATEVASTRHVEAALKAGVDVLWIGARTTGNPFLVEDICSVLRGVEDVDVWVKNPLNPDPELWIGALERFIRAGISRLGGIHRGFSVYHPSRYRNVPMWQVPAEIRRVIPGMPLICDPSHICGDASLVPEVALKAMEFGFDGLMIETHPNPARALSDAAQQLTVAQLAELLGKLKVRKQDSQPNDKIEMLRSQIDQLDDSIIDLISERLDIASEIGEIKSVEGIAVFQPERWEQVVSRVETRAADRGVSTGFISGLYRLIHQESIKRQM
ncbi:MAG: bifunctional 3-deoxy-7-phosphoheptulonate synthase/chorismate mutase type II [Bacteroidales bacterium]|nr:bifunctional 3-deoxy-7-phosphoheptulonate synthase/chorismate mutase type II [Bacteroidales bacterium]